MRDPWILAAPAAAWTARGNPGYAADVLQHTACGACSLGSEGLSDDVRPRTTSDLAPSLLIASGLRSTVDP